MKQILIISIIIFLPTIAISSSKHARFSVGAGIYNFMENGYSICRVSRGGCASSSNAQHNLENFQKRSLAYNVEYFPRINFLKYLKPLTGFLGTGDNAMYSYIGLSGDLFFGKCKCFVVTPSLAAGWYIDGDEIRLGHKVEFRSGGDITYKFKNNVRVGVGIFHLSNANLGDRNPGSEQFIFKYQIPLR